MSRGLATLALLLGCAHTHATLPISVTLERLVAEADHILVGSITGAFATDESGALLWGPAARTGPCLTNTIYLEVEVSETLVTNAPQVPRTLNIPLDRWMHYSLGQVLLVHRERSSPRLLLLQGTNFEPSVPGAFQWSLEDREFVLWLREQQAAERRSSEASRGQLAVGVHQPLADNCDSRGLGSPNVEATVTAVTKRSRLVDELLGQPPSRQILLRLERKVPP